LFLIARLLTEGASRDRLSGETSATPSEGVGFLRLLAVSVALCVVFVPSVLIPVLGGALEASGALFSFLLGFLGAQAVSHLLLRFWGFAPKNATALRLIAAAALGFMAASWVLVLALAVHPCH
jgi:hypothetical protein